MTFKGSDLLPPNASKLQRLWADAQWGRLASIDVEVIRRIADPATCPAELLPWLAAEFSVDAWDDAWPTATKRAVIAAAPEVHRLKGTRRAVRLALEALGVDHDLLEWWQADPPERRGTFAITIWSTGAEPPLSVAMLRRVRQQVRAAKPKSRVFSLRLGARADAGAVHIGLAARNRLKIVIGAET